MTDKEKLKKLNKLADAMYYAAMYLTTDASRLHKAMDEYHKFIINEYHKEEPVSEDKEKITYQGEEYIRCYHDELDEFANKYPKTVPPPEKKYAKYSDVDMVIAVKAGANWKEQQMMAKAVDGDITFDYYGDDDKTYGCIAHDSFCLEDFGLKDRDKVKVIVVKEE